MRDRARAFFYVSAGIFLLAASYHLGARNAGAQAGAGLSAVGVSGDIAWAVIGRDLYSMSWYGGLHRYFEPLPGTLRPVAVGDRATVVFEDGSVYRFAGPPEAPWTHMGTFPLGVTHSARQSWGQVKSRYLDRATPQQQGMGTRQVKDGQP